MSMPMPWLLAAMLQVAPLLAAYFEVSSTGQIMRGTKRDREPVPASISKLIPSAVDYQTEAEERYAKSLECKNVINQTLVKEHLKKYASTKAFFVDCEKIIANAPYPQFLSCMRKVTDNPAMIALQHPQIKKCRVDFAKSLFDQGDEVYRPMAQEFESCKQNMTTDGSLLLDLQRKPNKKGQEEKDEEQRKKKEEKDEEQRKKQEEKDEEKRKKKEEKDEERRKKQEEKDEKKHKKKEWYHDEEEMEEDCESKVATKVIDTWYTRHHTEKQPADSPEPSPEAQTATQSADSPEPSPEPSPELSPEAQTATQPADSPEPSPEAQTATQPADSPEPSPEAQTDS